VTVAGLLLTGGRSRRLGVDKAQLVLDGVTLAHRAAARLAAVCDPVLEVGPGYSALPAVREEPPGSGPLAALAAGGQALVRQGHDGDALLLAVDLPAMTVAFLELLRDRPGAPTLVPEVDGRLQPVCARYGRDAMTAADRLVRDGARSMHELVDTVEHAVLAEAEWRAVAGPDVLADVDTPDDARRLGLELGA
jgi:molybdopterin-guanine dinucleotide biosynthesis protein A